MKADIYKTKISDARWIAYDIPANLGWIAYIVALVLIFTNNSDCSKSILTYLGVIPAVWLLIGIGELISERIAKLDRILPLRRLLRGFGVITIGSFLGFVLSAVSFVVEMIQGRFCVYHLIMTIGGLVCGILAFLLFRGYRKVTDNH